MWEVVFEEDNREPWIKIDCWRISKDGEISYQEYENLRKKWRNWRVYWYERSNRVRFLSNNKGYDQNIFEKNPHPSLLQFKKDFKIQSIAPSEV